MSHHISTSVHPLLYILFTSLPYTKKMSPSLICNPYVVAKYLNLSVLILLICPYILCQVFPFIQSGIFQYAPKTPLFQFRQLLLLHHSTLLKSLTHPLKILIYKSFTVSAFHNSVEEYIMLEILLNIITALIS